MFVITKRNCTCGIEVTKAGKANAAIIGKGDGAVNVDVGGTEQGGVAKRDVGVDAYIACAVCSTDGDLTEAILNCR